MKNGVYAQGDPAVIAITSHFLGTGKNQFWDQVDAKGVFCAPDPQTWVVPAVASYLDSAATLDAPKVADVHEQPKTKAKGRR